MKFKKVFNFKETNENPEYIKRLSNLGVVNFGKGITDKNKERTPHYEMGECLEMFETNPIVAPAVNQLIEFIIPDKKMRVSSPDPKSQEFMEKWYELRDGSLEEVKNLLKTNVVGGNGYLEKRFMPYDDTTVLDNIFSINDVTRIYVNPDDVGGEVAFIFELPVGIKSFWYMGELQTPTFYKITYIKNFQWMFKMIWGFPIPGWKIGHYKSGWSRDNLYGRSQLASAIDANNIFNQILSSWDTISRTRQIGQKLISVADGETGMNIDQERLDELAEELEDTSASYKLFNVPLKFVQTDINSAGSYDLMESPVDMLRRMIMMSLLPQHLTPWSDSGTTMGSEQAMPPFLGRVKAKQNELIAFLNDNVINELRKVYDWIHPETTHIFSEPKILGDGEYVRFVTDLVRDNLISIEQAQKYLVDKGILDEELFDIKSKEPVEPKEEKMKESVILTEGRTAKPYSFETFKKKLKNRKGIDLKDSRELKNYDIGGQVIRLIEDVENYSIYNGLSNIENFTKTIIELSTVKKAFEDYRQRLIKEQDEYKKGDSDEDKIIDEMERDIQKILQKQLLTVFGSIDNNKLKKEGFKESFVNPKILSGLDGIFSGFNKKIGDVVRRAMDKLGVVVTSDEDGVKPDLSTKNLLSKKQTLMKRSLIDQIKATKDKTLSDIKTRISNGIASGQSTTKIKQDVEKDFNYEKGIGYKFKRIINTTSRQSAGILKLKKLLSMGFETYIWDTMDDAKVRPEHAKKNKRVYNIEESLSSNKMDAYPGKDFNCRCRIRPYE